MMKYAVLIERASENFAAYVPDLPGCVATAATEEEVLRAIRKAIEWHIEGLIEDGVPVPLPQSVDAVMVEVDSEPQAIPV
jgi:predicted RNase H-like HicB family nuclease